MSASLDAYLSSVPLAPEYDRLELLSDVIDKETCHVLPAVRPVAPARADVPRKTRQAPQSQPKARSDLWDQPLVMFILGSVWGLHICAVALMVALWVG